MKIERINHQEDILPHLTDGTLHTLYRSCFNEPPYEESFTKEEIDGFFKEYIADGIVFLCYEESESKNVIGFAAAVPLRCNPEVAYIAKEYGIDENNTWYYADLGVSKDFRRNGIAGMMSKEVIFAVPNGNNLLMRTQENNTASINCHTKIGYKIIEGMMQDVKRTDRKIRDRRLFLFYNRKEER